ncbi:hypothetical protein TNCV_3522501 [Trichonephila clavipes]|uniref:Uncharacterized protein n=1 Tax=Trichonephila clavipes TaxID=2585209 RepID=A0A8X6W8U2_TRICX|nr:hypothetical protein TNCV_3522501 [Trichonephila clavipes]
MKIVLEIVQIDTSSQVFVSGSNLYTGGIFVDGFSNLYTGGIFVDGSLKNTPLHSPRAESDLRVSLLDNGLVGPYSDTVLVTSFSPGSSTCASRVRWLNFLPPSLTPGGCLDSALYSMFMWKFPTTLGHPHKQCPHCSRTKDLK